MMSTFLCRFDKQILKIHSRYISYKINEYIDKMLWVLIDYTIGFDNSIVFFKIACDRSHNSIWIKLKQV
jgi:hypothetical protein